MDGGWESMDMLETVICCNFSNQISARPATKRKITYLPLGFLLYKRHQLLLLLKQFIQFKFLLLKSNQPGRLLQMQLYHK